MPNLHNIITICRRATSISDQDLSKVCNTIDSTMHQYRFKAFEAGSGEGLFMSSHWSTDFYKLTLALPSQQKSIRELGSTLHFAARLGLCQYLKAFCDIKTTTYLSRYGLVLHAIESWKDVSTSVALHDRTDTLLFLLSDAARPEDLGMGCSLWQNAVLMCETLLDENRPEEAAELLRVFLVTARSRHSLMATRIYNEKSEMVHPASIIWNLKAANDRLGTELEEFGFSKGPVYELSQYYRDTIASSTNRSLRGGEDGTRQISSQPEPVLQQRLNALPDTQKAYLRPTENTRDNTRDHWENDQKYIQSDDHQSRRSVHGNFNSHGISGSTHMYLASSNPAHGHRNFNRPNHESSYHTKGFHEIPLQQPQQYQHSETQYGMPFRSPAHFNSSPTPATAQPRQAPYASLNPEPYSDHRAYPNLMPWPRPITTYPNLPPGGGFQLRQNNQQVPAPYPTATQTPWHKKPSSSTTFSQQPSIMTPPSPHQGSPADSPFEWQLYRY